MQNDDLDIYLISFGSLCKFSLVPTTVHEITVSPNEKCSMSFSQGTAWPVPHGVCVLPFLDVGSFTRGQVLMTHTALFLTIPSAVWPQVYGILEIISTGSC